MLLLTIANSRLQPAVCVGEECELIFQQFARWFVKSMVCSQEDLIYELRRLKVVCNGLMPKSMVSLAVVYCRVPSTCMWYSLFDSDFLLAMFRVLHFGKPRLIVKV